MREEENKSEEEETKAKKRERFRGARGERRERRVDQKKEKKNSHIYLGPPMNKNNNKIFAIHEQYASKFEIALFIYAKYFPTSRLYKCMFE